MLYWKFTTLTGRGGVFVVDFYFLLALAILGFMYVLLFVWFIYTSGAPKIILDYK